MAVLEQVWQQVGAWVEMEMRRSDSVDVCEMLEARYSTAEAMAQLAAQLRALYQDCLSVLPPQHQQHQDDYVQVVPACPEGEIVHGHAMLWQLGFQARAAIKGPPEKLSLEKSLAPCTHCNFLNSARSLGCGGHRHRP